MTQYKPEGASSRMIYRYFTEGKYNGNMGSTFIPYDYEDFGRCYRLLKHYPQWYDRISEMKHVSKEWEIISDNWNELTKLYEDYLTNANIKSLQKININLRNYISGEDWLFV